MFKSRVILLVVLLLISSAITKPVVDEDVELSETDVLSRIPKAVPTTVQPAVQIDTSDTTSEENDMSDTTSEEKGPVVKAKPGNEDKSDHSDTTSEENDMSETTSEEKDLTPNTTSEESDDKSDAKTKTNKKPLDSNNEPDSSSADSESLAGQSDEECDSRSVDSRSNSASKSESGDKDQDPKSEDLSASAEKSSSESDESDEVLNQVGKRKLLVIMIDGMRHDYVMRDARKLPNFRRLATKGVSATVKPVFPSNSYPNWYSIATGKYPEKHGLVQNFMYDEKQNGDHFLMGPHPNASHCHWWSAAEPLWITAQRAAGIRSALYWWDGCQVRIRGRRANKCIRYRDILPAADGSGPTAMWTSVLEDFQAALETALDEIRREEYSLSMMYLGSVDHAGHVYGPDSRRVKYAVRDVDRLIGHLLDEVAERDLTDKLNIMIVSDHGMATIQNYVHIALDEVMDLNDVEKVVGGGALALLLPEEGKTDAVYDALRSANVAGLNVYTKETIPERLRYADHHRILPIVVTADEGYLIDTPDISGKIAPEADEADPSIGGHGYDPDYVDEMRTIMYGVGPAFREGYDASDRGVDLDMVDHYQLMAHLIGVTAREHDGRWSRVWRLLKESESDELPDESGESSEAAPTAGTVTKDLARLANWRAITCSLIALVGHFLISSILI